MVCLAPYSRDENQGSGFQACPRVLAGVSSILKPGST